MDTSMNINEIWLQYRATLKSFLHARISDSDEVDDLLQEILIRTFNNLHTVKSQSSIKSWLFQIAQRVIIDFYRKQGKREKSRQRITDDLWYEQEDIDAQKALSACIEPFIHALQREEAELLTAIDIEGQSQKEYADNLGISYSTLKSRVQKARKALRRVFENCCHLSLDRHGNITDFDPKSSNCKNC